jgi:hypothetical protein
VLPRRGAKKKVNGNEEMSRYFDQT